MPPALERRSAGTCRPVDRDDGLANMGRSPAQGRTDTYLRAAVRARVHLPWLYARAARWRLWRACHVGGSCGFVLEGATAGRRAKEGEGGRTMLCQGRAGVRRPVQRALAAFGRPSTLA